MVRQNVLNGLAVAFVLNLKDMSRYDRLAYISSKVDLVYANEEMDGVVVEVLLPSSTDMRYFTDSVGGWNWIATEVSGFSVEIKFKK